MNPKFFTFFALAFFPPMLWAADGAPFRNFRGNFSEQAHVKVMGAQPGNSTGRIRQSFRVGKSGEDARLQITGALKLAGATREFKVIYLFRRPNAAGERLIYLSNLAPGVDDGFSADRGTYHVSPRAIRAEVPFAFGTLTGNVQLVIRQKNLRHGSRLRLTQTLVTDALPRPIVWRFTGRNAR